MTRLVHLTDLHFGMERGDLVAPLSAALRRAAPDLVVVTGDLTHRARPAQFRQAVDFLRSLELPFLAVPGNHDVPLFNLPLRLMAPFLRWRRGVGATVPPMATVGPLRILSANTADPFRWRRGVLRAADVQRATADLSAGALNVLACHHPLTEPPGFQRGETRGAAQALPALARQGLHVVLSGHLHHWNIGLGITPTRPQPVLMVQTGTALCARAGERDHGFALIEAQGADLAVTPWIAGAAGFAPQPARRFRREGGLWHAMKASPATSAMLESW